MNTKRKLTLSRCLVSALCPGSVGHKPCVCELMAVHDVLETVMGVTPGSLGVATQPHIMRWGFLLYSSPQNLKK